MLDSTLGHYRLLRELGRGGMGVVYLATDTLLNREVALKVLSPTADRNSDATRRFLRECKISGAVNHPNIVTVFEVGEAEQGRYIAMEYIDGVRLAEALSQKRFSILQLLYIARQIVAALDAAHGCGIIHRDIKPTNVMMTASGQIKVLDFGLARMRPAGVSEMDGLVTQTLITRAHQRVGTLYYMSPEQLAGRELDTRSDIFSLGVTLYEMLAGHRPFEGSSVGELITRIVHAEPKPLSRFNYDVPPRLDAIVRKCLEKDPAQRYQTARELWVDLSGVEQDISGGSGNRAAASSRG